MTSNRPQTLRPDQARCLGLSGNDCIGEDVRVSAVRREPAGGAWTAKWAKDSLNRAVDITRTGSLPATLSRATARPPPRAASASSPWRAASRWRGRQFIAPNPRPATRRPHHFRTACRRPLCLLKPGHRCFGHPGKVVGQQVTRAGLHPLVEVGLFELAVVPSLHDLKIFIADVLDRVPEALRNVGDIARLDLGHLAAPAGAEERHLPLAA